MGTQVRLTRSGGIAGMSMVASVDLDELPAETAEKIRDALAKVDFDPPPAPSAARQGWADTYQYDLVVSNDESRSLRVQEPSVSPELRELVDVLLPLAQPE